MYWASIISVILLSTVKFMFSPLVGEELHLPFYTTYFSAVAGGILGASVFYFSSNFFITLSLRKKAKKEALALEKGLPIKKKKKFTRVNKLIVYLKTHIGQMGICVITPLFLSVPVGCFISAKFYGNSKKTFPLIVLGMFINGLATTSLTYWILD